MAILPRIKALAAQAAVWCLLALASACNLDNSVAPTPGTGLGLVSPTMSTLTASAASVGIGTSVTITLSPRDAAGQPVILDRRQAAVVFAVTGGTSTGVLGPVTRGADGIYVVSFTGVSPGTPTTITATINGQALGEPVTITVAQGGFSASHSRISVASNTVSSAATTSVTLLVRDGNDAPVVIPGLQVAFTISGGTSTGSFSSPVNQGNGSYTATFTGLKAGTPTSLGATLNGVAIAGPLPTISVTAGAPVSVQAVSGAQQAATVGQALPLPFTALVTDVNGNPVPGANLVWTTTGNAGLGSASTSTNASGIAVDGLTLGTATGSYVSTASLPSVSGSGAAFTAIATPGPLDHLLFSGLPATVSAGTNFGFTLTAYDGYGNRKTDYAGTVHFSSSDSDSPLLPPDYSFTDDDQGAHLFSAALKFAGNQTITASAVASNSANVTSAPILITAATASQLVFIHQPATTAAGGALPTLVVRALDAYGNTASSYAGSISVGIANDAGPGGFLSGTTSLAATAGSASFAGLSMTKSGVGYTLRASAVGLTPVTSTAFTILPGPPAAIAVMSGNQQTTTVATALPNPLIALVTDAYGNAVSNAAVDWSTSSGTLATATAQSATNGLVSNTLTLASVAGSANVIASLHGSAMSATFTETGTAAAAAQLIFTVQPSGGVAPGVALSTQPAVTIEDAYGNPVRSGPDASATVSLTLSGGTGSLTGTSSVTASQGVAVFSGIGVTAQGGGKILTATKASTFLSGGSFALTATSLAFSINPPQPGGFAITSAQGGNASAALAWGASSDATNYTIQYGTSSGQYSSNINNAVSPTSVSGLTPGVTYYFRVTATNVTGSTSSAEVSATPLAGFSLSAATVTAANAIHLAWAVSAGATSYVVSYGTSSGNYPNTAASTNATSADITGLTGGVVYYFMVTAQNATGSVNASGELSATPLNAFALSSATPGLGSVSLAWAASAGQTSYDLLYDTVSHVAGGSYANTLTGVASGMAVSGLVTGTTYYFRVRANDANGAILSSNELSAAPTQNNVMTVPFTAGTDSNYTFSDTTEVSLVGGVVRLTPASQSDSVANTGVVSGGFNSAVTQTGVLWDGTANVLRLNTTTNTAELDGSWTPQWSNLVGYWKLDESAGSGSVADSSPAGGNTGTVIGGVTQGVAGKLSAAASFDGASGYVDVGSGSSLDITGDFTLSAWVNSTSAPSGNYPAVVCKEAASGNRTGFCIGLHNTGSFGGAWYAEVFNNSVNWTLHGASNVADGNWHWLVESRQGSTLSVYQDGVLVNSTSAFSGSLGTSTDLTIGTDQTSNTLYAGTIDEVALWNVALSPTQIQAIFTRQAAKFSGQLTSRVFDAYASQAWTSLAASSTLPFGKELPAVGASENAASYSAESANLTSGLLGLWHMDEASWNGSSGEVIDSSGQGNNGVALNGATTSPYGRLGRAGVFVNSNPQMVNVPDTGNLNSPTNVTISFWMYATTLAQAPIVARWYEPTNQRIWAVELSDTNGNVEFDTSPDGGYHGGNTAVSTAAPIQANAWYHVVAISNGSQNLIYVNGVQVANQAISNSGLLTTAVQPMTIGAAFEGGNEHFFYGMVDEVAVWNRALSGNEILELYRRGANRLKYQVRSCSDSACSNGAPTWQGPDGTPLTYFSELYNTAGNALGGVVTAGSPVMTFSNFVGQGLTLAANRYFQYRVVLESDDQNSLCNYASMSAPCSPELQSLAIGPAHYSNTPQWITSNASLGLAFQSINTNGFSETLGANGCSAGTRYALSQDGTNFYSWNGNAWGVSTGYASANPSATLQANIASFPGAVGKGTLRIRTFLASTGTSACEVDNIEVDGTTY